MGPRTSTDTVTLDAARWPVLLVTQRVAQLSDDERLASLAAIDALLSARPGPYSLVLDNSLAGPLSAKQRSLVAQYMAKHVERDRARCMCTAFVITSPLVRGVMTAIQWLRRPAVETQVFASVDEALWWATARHREKQEEKQAHA